MSASTAAATLPGSYVFLVYFPGLLTLTPKMGDASNTIAFSAVAVFIGQLVQALASLLEPFLFKTWKGKSSTLALTTGLGERCTSRAGAEINAATVVEGLRKLGNIGAVTWLR